MTEFERKFSHKTCNLLLRIEIHNSKELAAYIAENGLPSLRAWLGKKAYDEVFSL